ncbi:nicotinate-nucleotide--dimethylbenzimidazole phosphoribosyltransferase [Sphingobium cupriresistens]|uniref:Nicotinate-nucleotide--dimethylbenzimidazole phosphoribosyltransferase n=1 Tax=Sphingobium cupriresistens LL01 TaxID=1420583 RepID=A0A0J7XKF8_9SPHN|nr:nicotinate-nucleotide--dimethylbenzimidazole phosphoribosyltransferase [Sphingobium cupriresistens]KMS52172.1 nicotinate-nucleotide--dimethylbenzimidazole phosphoribosyltransferase [Sphingobium cupriresistens LL01]
MSLFPTEAAFDAALASLPRADLACRAAAAARQGQLTKPAGSLGRLEEIAIFLAGWQRRARPHIDRGRAAVFAGNHGVTRHGVSAFPPIVTAQMVANFAAGGAAINALAGAAGLDLHVVPIDLDRPTEDFTVAAAMSQTDCLAALNCGADMVDPGLDLLLLGEMGIGNSTAAAALCQRSFGGSAREWVGAGTGVDAHGLAMKRQVVELAMAYHADAPMTPFETLRRVGGREIVAIAGAMLAARHRHVPVVLDGFICAAALAPLAVAMPTITDHIIAGHRSAEAGHGRLLDRLGLRPLLDLDMRLGEGSGGAVAVAVIRTALAAHDQMATFADAGVSAGG